MYQHRIARVLLAAALLSGCAEKDDGFRIPRGSKVSVEHRNGTRVTGTLESVDAAALFVMEQAGGQIRRIPQEDVAAIRAVFLPEAESSKPVARVERAKAEPAKAGAPGYRDYRVPAGTLLPIELRAVLSSASSRERNVVRGRLVRPLVVEGVELIPAGATVFGTVTQVIEAERSGERSRLALSFQVLEHPATRSRVTVRTTEVAFESKEAISRRTPAGTPDAQVALQPGTDVSASLLDPVTVRIPVL